jgi:hypothetical protein
MATDATKMPKWHGHGRVPGLTFLAGRLPTLTRSSYGSQRSKSPGAKKRPSLPTLIKRDAGSYDHVKRGANSEGGDPLPRRIGGTLNPEWCEWYMGWPIGWTGLGPLEMDGYRRWLLSHGIIS